MMCCLTKVATSKNGASLIESNHTPTLHATDYQHFSLFKIKESIHQAKKMKLKKKLSLNSGGSLTRS